MRKGPPSPAGPRRGESVGDWWFGLGGPARYRIAIEDADVPDPITVWATSRGEALDAAIVSVDTREKINVRGAPARVDEIGRAPDRNDVKATDVGWPFAPPPRPPRYVRDDLVSALILVGMLAFGGLAPASFTFAFLADLDGDWLRAGVAAVAGTAIASALAALFMA